MEVDEGGEGYGFARRNHPVRKKAGRRAAVHSSAPAAPAAYRPRSQKPAWVWLLIGILLGAGGTLLTASFWFPVSGERHITALETVERPSGRSTADTAAAETLERETAKQQVSPDEPGPEATSVGAVQIERQAVSLESEPSPRSPDDVRYDIWAASANAGASDTGTTKEMERPAIASDVDDDAGQRQPADPRATALSDPGQALAALVSETAPTATSERRTDDRSGGSDEDRPDRAAARPSQPEDPAAAETLPGRPAATPPDDEERQAADTEPTATEAAPPNGGDRRELPPRIRRALQAASANSATGTNGENGSRLYRVQLAAVDDEAAARVFWREANERLPDVFADVEPIFDQRSVDERVFLRVWVGAFDNRLDADGYCGWLKLQGQDCFVTRVDNL